MSVTDDRQTDGRATANSQREREFAKSLKTANLNERDFLIRNQYKRIY